MCVCGGGGVKRETTSPLSHRAAAAMNAEQRGGDGQRLKMDGHRKSRGIGEGKRGPHTKKKTNRFLCQT